MNWVNLGIIYWMILITANSMLMAGGFSNSTTGSLLACAPDEVKVFNPAINNYTCQIASNANTPTNVSNDPNFQPDLGSQVLNAVGSAFQGAGSFLATAAIKIIPGATVAASFIGNFLFGYLGLFTYIANSFPGEQTIASLMFALGFVFFVIQILSGFYFMITLIAGFKGAKIT